MLPESMVIIKKAAAEVPDEALPVLDPFTSKFYRLCKKIAAEAQQASVAPEKQKQNQEDKEQGSKPIYNDDNAGAF